MDVHLSKDTMRKTEVFSHLANLRFLQRPRERHVEVGSSGIDRILEHRPGPQE